MNKIFSLNSLFLSALPFVLSLLACFFQPRLCSAQDQKKDTSFVLRGIVQSELGEGLQGASLEAGKAKAISGSGGNFVIRISSPAAQLRVSHTGYQTVYITPGNNTSMPLLIKLKPTTEELETVIVSTGLQTLPRERATGSFEKITGEMLNRKVSPDILSRLEGLSASILFDNRGIGASPFSIRGLSTIYANQRPLVVLDNFPYEGDLANINPEDIEGVTILKDAAAASIWGVRAGNGVIVLTTKKGYAVRKPEVSAWATRSWGGKPNLFKEHAMSTSDFIDLEIFLFSKGFYRRDETSILRPALSPVVELLIKKRDGNISATAADEAINALRTGEVRRDLSRHVYQQVNNQQYGMQLRGGSVQYRYSLSGGFDRNENAVGASYERVSVRSANTILLSDKLSLDLGLLFTQTGTRAGRPLTIQLGNSKRLYPYASFTDGAGHPAVLNRGYRNTFLQQSLAKGFLDWDYRPLDDFADIDNKTKGGDLLLNTGIHYKFFKGITGQVLYQLQRGNTESRNLQSETSYFTRDLINLYTQINPDGSLTRNIPLGGILDISNRTLLSHSLRGQLGYAKNFKDHAVNAIAGGEVRTISTNGNTTRTYGYNGDNLTYSTVNLSATFPQANFTALRRRIPDPTSFVYLTNRYLSQFANASYGFKNRYLVSASIRRDESNLFGVATNQRFVPLWSTGFAWDLAKESFYRLSFLPQLRLRATYGVSGNLDPSLSAYTIVFNNSGNLNAQNYGVIRNPPNPELSWEKTALFNVGIDFASKANRIKGSLEYYTKHSNDLVGDISVDQTTGAQSPLQTFTYRGNIGDMKGRGIDLSLHLQTLQKIVSWTTDLFLSYAASKVTSYPRKPPSLFSYINGGNLVIPLEGKPPFSIFTHPWAGLDTAGNPQGIVGGKPSTDYAAILYKSHPKDLIYHGPALAPWFGSLINTISWKGLTAYANISYRFGYYFIRPSLHYSALFTNRETSGDYSKRWQKKGDENITSVPSLIYPSNSDRDDFYNSSAALVEKGDHIRLQDLGLGYELKKLKGLPRFKNINAFLYISNLGILWKKTDSELDPDYKRVGINGTKIYALSLKANF